ITGRFLNLLGLFAGTIPLIVIQLNALTIGNQVVLNSMKVIDQTTLRRDDETEGTTLPTTREDWIGRTFVGDGPLSGSPLPLRLRLLREGRGDTPIPVDYTRIARGCQPLRPPGTGAVSILDDSRAVI